MVVHRLQHDTGKPAATSGLRCDSARGLLSEPRLGRRRSAEALDRVLQTNLVSAFATIQAFYPLLKVSSWGHESADWKG